MGNMHVFENYYLPAFFLSKPFLIWYKCSPSIAQTLVQHYSPINCKGLWNNEIHLLSISQASTQLMWNIWRQARRLTFVPGWKSESSLNEIVCVLAAGYFFQIWNSEYQLMVPWCETTIVFLTDCYSFDVNPNMQHWKDGLDAYLSIVTDLLCRWHTACSPPPLCYNPVWRMLSLSY